MVWIDAYNNSQEFFLAESLWICNNIVNFEFANSLKRLPALWTTNLLQSQVQYFVQTLNFHIPQSL